MPKPTHCPNPSCSNHGFPAGTWYSPHGTYKTKAFGRVRRFRCNACQKTFSEQTESVHYYAKKPIPLDALADQLTGRSLHEISRYFKVSDGVIRSNVLRLGRQAMAAQIHLLSEMPKRECVVMDGLRSFIGSQDYPCDLTTVVDRDSLSVISMIHFIFRRGGRMTRQQESRSQRKYSIWSPEPGSIQEEIALLGREMMHYLKLDKKRPAILDSDEHYMYFDELRRGYPGLAQLEKKLVHVRTSAKLRRDRYNRLFPVNYLDRLLRLREQEHTRETIAFGRHPVMQMHRAWIWAWDHNFRREFRVVEPEQGVHAAQGLCSPKRIASIMENFFTQRLRIKDKKVPESIRKVWMAEIPGPAVRWKINGTKGARRMRVPTYAVRDLLDGTIIEGSLPFQELTDVA
jgi:hypothetical protein